MEAQLLRNGLPLTRPSRAFAGRDSFEPGKLAAFKLFPGSTNAGEVVTASVYNAGYCAHQWAVVRAAISIDGIPWEDKPGMVFVDHGDTWFEGGHIPLYGVWTCVINFPIMSHLPTFAGVHTLLLRTICQEA